MTSTLKKDRDRLEQAFFDSLTPPQRGLLRDGAGKGRSAKVARAKFASSCSDAQLKAFALVRVVDDALAPPIDGVEQWRFERYTKSLRKHR